MIAQTAPILISIATAKSLTEAVTYHVHPFEHTATGEEKMAKPFLFEKFFANLHQHMLLKPLSERS